MNELQNNYILQGFKNPRTSKQRVTDPLQQSDLNPLETKKIQPFNQMNIFKTIKEPSLLEKPNSTRTNQKRKNPLRK